jgi:hypothetical protein
VEKGTHRELHPGTAGVRERTGIFAGNRLFAVDVHYRVFGSVSAGVCSTGRTVCLRPSGTDELILQTGICEAGSRLRASEMATYPGALKHWDDLRHPLASAYDILFKGGGASPWKACGLAGEIEPY